MNDNVVDRVNYILLEDGRWIVRPAKLIRESGLITQLVTEFGFTRPRGLDPGITLTLHVLKNQATHLSGLVNTSYLVIVQGKIEHTLQGYQGIEVSEPGGRSLKEMQGYQQLLLN